MFLNKKCKVALRAAVPFGGVAQSNERPTLDALVSAGLVIIDCYSPLDGSLGYSLTAQGREVEKTLDFPS